MVTSDSINVLSEILRQWLSRGPAKHYNSSPGRVGVVLFRKSF